MVKYVNLKNKCGKHQKTIKNTKTLLNKETNIQNPLARNKNMRNTVNKESTNARAIYNK